jgi:hypothetical protein
MKSVQPLSTAHSPDLDWSQIRETVALLNLAVARIEYSMRDGNDSVDTLTDWFTTMVQNMQVIETASKDLPESEAKQAIQNNSKSAAEHVQSAIIAFQFYDKLTQRLTHVSKSLSSLTALVSDPERLYVPYEWTGLQTMIKSKYTLDSDKKMFEDIMSGMSIEEALQEGIEHAKQQPGGDIELF